MTFAPLPVILLGRKTEETPHKERKMKTNQTNGQSELHQYHIDEGPYYTRITARDEQEARDIHFEHNGPAKFPLKISKAW